jgi:hypothetical protein
MHGGTISSGRSYTFPVRGSYWRSWTSSFSHTTAPFVVPTFLPSSKADSSVMEMRPLSMSASRFFSPSCRDSPRLSIAAFSASGLVSR